jgi:hypothetical protein
MHSQDGQVLKIDTSHGQGQVHQQINVLLRISSAEN